MTKQLTPRQIKFVKAKVRGLPGYKAAMEASGGTVTTMNSATTIAARMSRNVTVQQALDKALKAAGITIEKAIEPITAGLKANKVATVEGDFYETEVVDHGTRLRASAMALELLGAKKNPNDPNNNPPVNPVENGKLLLEALQNQDEVEISRVVFNKRSE